LAVATIASASISTLAAETNALSLGTYAITKTENKNFGSVTQYTYDSASRLTKVVFSQKTGDNVRSSTIVYKYSGYLCTSEVLTNTENGKNTYTETTTRSYNKNGTLAKSVFKYTSSDYSFTATTAYTYDKKLNLTKTIKTEALPDSSPTTTTSTYTYNSKNQPLKQITTYAGSTSKEVITYTYNTKGLLTKYVIDSGSRIRTTLYTYNASGLVTKENYTDTYQKEVCATQVSTYAYDKSGNVTKKVTTAEGTTTTYTYKYDSKGRLASETSTKGGKADSVKNYTFASTGAIAKFSQTKDGNTYNTTITSANTNFYVFYDLSFTYFVSKGSNTPSVRVIGSQINGGYGNMINNTDYKVSYTKSGSNIKIKVHFINDYYTYDDAILTIKALSPVTGLKAASVSKNAIKLSWKNVSGAKYYKVESSANGKTWKAVKTVSANTLTVSSLKTGAKYQYRVTALDSKKIACSLASAVLKTGTLTAAPAITLKSTKKATATASWKAVTGASKYVVYKSTNGKKWTKVTTTTKKTYTINKLASKKYTYVKVVAVNAYGKASAASGVKKIKVK